MDVGNLTRMRLSCVILKLLARKTNHLYNFECLLFYFLGVTRIFEYFADKVCVIYSLPEDDCGYDALCLKGSSILLAK